eukprot:scaffold259099_cov35-Prasinocladus_malaysianus.AAC.7
MDFCSDAGRVSLVETVVIIAVYFKVKVGSMGDEPAIASEQYVMQHANPKQKPSKGANGASRVQSSDIPVVPIYELPSIVACRKLSA